MSAQDVAALRELRVFAEVIGFPLTDAQAQALRLETRQTVIVAPRQTGKSYSLAVLALHQAFLAREQRVLIVSAGEDAARRLLAEVRRMAAGGVLAGSVVEDGASLLRLSNGSEVRSVPASERQIRGWSVDLLIVDEAALVADDLVFGAAIPTTAARPGARVVLASSPWGPSGAFYRAVVAGDSDHSRVFRWRLGDAPWITSEMVEFARSVLPGPRFRAEYEGEFVGASDAFFDQKALLDCVAAYELLEPDQADGEAIVLGLDWGRRFDSHAVVALGLLDDTTSTGGAAPYFVPWLESSQRLYSAQVERIVEVCQRRYQSPDVIVHDGLTGRLRAVPGYRYQQGVWVVRSGGRYGGSGYEVLAVFSEENGVGAAPTEQVKRDVPASVRVTGVHTSQRSKEDAYGRLATMISGGGLVLPAHDGLLRQLSGVVATPSPSGGLSIAAASDAVHDDLADALSLAAVAATAGYVRYARRPDRVSELSSDWVVTGGGRLVPKRPRPLHGRFGAQAAGEVWSW